MFLHITRKWIAWYEHTYATAEFGLAFHASISQFLNTIKMLYCYVSSVIRFKWNDCDYMRSKKFVVLLFSSSTCVQLEIDTRFLLLLMIQSVCNSMRSQNSVCVCGSFFYFVLMTCKTMLVDVHCSDRSLLPLRLLSFKFNRPLSANVAKKYQSVKHTRINAKAKMIQQFQ